MEKTGTARRTLLQHGLALLGGGLAVAAGTRWNRPAQAQERPGGARPLTLYARIRPLPGRAGHPGDTRVVSSGDLLDAPNGKRVGQFYTNCFCLGTPFGPHETAASNLELQMLQLDEGTLFGMGGGSPSHDDEKAHAIIGGTAKYAGARGTYVQRAASGKPGNRDLVEFVVTLAE